MKKLIILSMMVLLGAANSLLAYYDSSDYPFKVVSLRTQALGSAVLDDLDRSFDPIELYYVDGFRLFTNLGNDDSGTDKLLSGTGNSKYLIGFAMQNPFMDKFKNAMLFKYTNTDNSNQVQIDHDLDGNIDVTGNGEVSSEYTAFTDANENGFYDLKTTNSTTKNDFDYNDYFSFTTNNVYPFSGLIFGLKFGYEDSEKEFTVAAETPEGALIGNLSTGIISAGISAGDASFDYNYKTFIIADEYNKLVQSEKGDFLTDDNLSTTTTKFSVMKPDFKGFELRGDLSYETKDRSIVINDTYAGDKETFDPTIVNFKDKYSENGSYNDTEETTGGLFSIGTAIHKTMKKADNRDASDYFEIGGSFGIGSYDYTNSWERNSYTLSIDHNLNPDSVDFVDDWTKVSDTKKEILNDDGTVDTYGFGVTTRFNQNLNEKVRFVAGTYYGYTTSTRETKYNSSFEEIASTVTGQSFDNSSTDWFDNAEDTRKTTTTQLLADRTLDIYTTAFRASSGIEFKFTKSNHWLMRIGSIYNVVKTVTDDKKQVTSANPTIIINEAGDGSYTETHFDNIYNSEAKHSVTTVSNTLFTYGIGYQPNENLEINFASVFDGTGNTPTNGSQNEDIFDIDFIKSIKLGFSLKF